MEQGSVVDQLYFVCHGVLVNKSQIKPLVNVSKLKVSKHDFCNLNSGGDRYS